MRALNPPGPTARHRLGPDEFDVDQLPLLALLCLRSILDFCLQQNVCPSCHLLDLAPTSWRYEILISNRCTFCSTRLGKMTVRTPSLYSAPILDWSTDAGTPKVLTNCPRGRSIRRCAEASIFRVPRMASRSSSTETSSASRSIPGRSTVMTYSPSLSVISAAGYHSAFSISSLASVSASLWARRCVASSNSLFIRSCKTSKSCSGFHERDILSSLPRARCQVDLSNLSD